MLARYFERAKSIVKHHGDTVAELEQALALYERKGNLVMADRTQELLA